MSTKADTRELDERHKQARAARRLLEPEWFLSLAYFQNQQWVRWDGNQLHKPQLAGNRITVVENRITGVVRTELAKMTKNRPVFVVTPNTGDEQDTNAARMAEQIMRYLWKHLKMHEMALKALEWSRICGPGFLKIYWDSTLGPEQDVLVGPDGKVLSDPESGRPMRGDQATADMFSQQMLLPPGAVRSKRVAQGDIRVEVRSPFQMFIDPLADSFPEAEWLIDESIKSADYVYRRYGVELKADTPANPGLVEARLMGAQLGQGGGGVKGVRVREFWSKPCRDYPNGCRIVWAQNQVLEQDERPFDPQPYVMLSGIPVPGRMFPMGVVELLRGSQTELNKTLSQMAENRNRVGNPTLLASKQAVQDPDKFMDAMTLPGGAYFYDDVGSPNAKPEYLAAPPLPEYVTEMPQRIAGAIEDISGQHEVTNAQVPPGVTAASAITLLQEADDTRLGLAIADYEVQLGRLGQKALELVAANYSSARTIRLAGENGAWEFFDFRGAMLRGNTHVEVQAGSAFPQSKAAKQAMIQDWMTFFVQSGNPPHGRQLAQFMRDSGMGATDRLVEDFSVDETQVNRENVLLVQGQPLQINAFDNDEAHIDGHTEFQKSAGYAQLPPEVQQVFEQHVLLHRQRLAQQQQAQMQAQLQAQGISPEQQQAQQQMQQAQAQQQLAQTQQQAQLQAAQAGQQMTLKDAQNAQQQGFQAAQSDQQQRQAEELHQQKLRHAQEVHEMNLRRQAQQAQQQGVDRGRRAA